MLYILVLIALIVNNVLKRFCGSNVFTIPIFVCIIIRNRENI